MEKKVNSEGYPASCRNCNYWGNRGKIEMQFSNKGNKSKILVGICYNADNKLKFIHTGEKTCCIMTQANAICDNFKWRIE